VGLRWQPVDGVTLRGSRSRNFRAPSLSQLFAPSSQNLSSTGNDPCDADRISSGPNPTQRRAACLALFAANPTYGTGGPGGAAAGASAAARLATFQDSSENFTTAIVTTGGNPNLMNEVSKTWTYGIVLQPKVVPGLTFTADRIEIDLTGGLVAFTTQDFTAACYDDPNPAAGTCSAFTRLTTATASSQAGSIATGTTTTFNAGIIRYRGETYDLNYAVPLERIFGGDPGKLDLDVTATHTALLESSVTGSVFVRSDGTANSSITSTPQPTWAGRFNAAYQTGPFRFSYQAFYLGPVIAAPNATIENNPNPRIGANLTHSLSMQVQIKQLTFRVGVTNLTDEQPSYPTLNYGDIIGRSYYAGAKVRF
jgi:outer membrane receptor protein involved in Fe transport